MDNFLKSSRKMTTKDWAIDVGVAVAAFAVACVQLMLTVSSIIIPDLALRQSLGLVNVVPEFGAFVALALTTFPLVVRRVFPWPVMLFVLVAHCMLQNDFTGFALSPAGLLVALFTVAAERPTHEAVVAALLAAGGSILFPGSSVTPSLAFFVQVQNLGLIAAAAAAASARTVLMSAKPSAAPPKPNARAKRKPPAVWKRSACASRGKCTTSPRILFPL